MPILTYEDITRTHISMIEAGLTMKCIQSLSRIHRPSKDIEEMIRVGMVGKKLLEVSVGQRCDYYVVMEGGSGGEGIYQPD